MKNKIMLKLMVVIYFCVFTKSSAQDNIVTMDSNMNIRINVNTIDNLSETYTIDVSGFHFESEKVFKPFAISLLLIFTPYPEIMPQSKLSSNSIRILYSKDNIPLKK